MFEKPGWRARHFSLWGKPPIAELVADAEVDSGGQRGASLGTSVDTSIIPGVRPRTTRSRWPELAMTPGRTACQIPRLLARWCLRDYDDPTVATEKLATNQGRRAEKQDPRAG